MVKVLIFGGCGFLGAETALGLKRAGHSVVVVAHQMMAPELEQTGVEFVKGDIDDLKSLEPQIQAADVIIDFVFNPDQASKKLESNLNLLKAIENQSKQLGHKKRYIYTSGVLVYGDQPSKLLTETDEPKHSKLKGRYEHDQAVINSREAIGIVVRPGFVYGGRTKALSQWMGPNDKGEWIIEGNPDKMWSWVHVQDLVDFYVALVNAPIDSVAGQIFNVGDTTRITFAEMREGFARSAGYKGQLGKGNAPKERFPALCEVSCIASSQKAHKLLGWTPRRGPLDKMYDAVYKDWQTMQQMKPQQPVSTQQLQQQQQQQPVGGMPLKQQQQEGLYQKQQMGMPQQGVPVSGAQQQMPIKNQ